MNIHFRIIFVITKNIALYDRTNALLRIISLQQWIKSHFTLHCWPLSIPDLPSGFFLVCQWWHWNSRAPGPPPRSRSTRPGGTGQHTQSPHPLSYHWRNSSQSTAVNNKRWRKNDDIKTQRVKDTSLSCIIDSLLQFCVMRNNLYMPIFILYVLFKIKIWRMTLVFFNLINVYLHF